MIIGELIVVDALKQQSPAAVRFGSDEDRENSSFRNE